MANPPKKKGTGGETELLRLLSDEGLAFVRTPPTSTYDLTNSLPGRLELEPLEVLATRPDRGQWLVTMRADQFAQLLLSYNDPDVWETHIEVKRYARFSLHTIFEGKFGKSK
jgi:hypothetical protein